MKHIESIAARWKQHLSNIWVMGIKLSVTADTYTDLCYTDTKSPINVVYMSFYGSQEDTSWEARKKGSF